MKTSKEIRQDFIEFFKKYDHTFVRSSPVAPLDDPTLMFTNAGMNQFKDVFLGTGSRPYNRAANSQKCIRVSGKHNDLEEVGYDSYHHTYFEMLGNWSFGDYFKKDAIKWAWELLTEVWGIPKERLYATVFGGDTEDGLAADTEAEQLWKEVTDIDPSHILRCGKKDNFWEMGETGPCGPCSEIHIDLTPDGNGGDLVNADNPNVIEIWNLVFIQFNRKNDGKLESLPAQHVDTGMGFERVVRVLQEKSSNYDTDVFQPILKHIGKLTNIEYETAPEEQQIAFRVIADHVRMLTFSISDGAMPSNDGRGYVLRRILRRAARYARKLEMHEPFIYEVVPSIVAINGEDFPEIVVKQNYVMEVIKAEETSFNRTLDRGIDLFNTLVQKMKNSGEKTVSGEAAFKLYDTYGFPLDLTRVMAEEASLNLDEKGFEVEMEAQRDRARSAGKFSVKNDENEWVTLIEEAEQAFVGYEETDVQTEILRYSIRGKETHIVLKKNPFYAESGGQVGDRGKIVGENFELAVLDTQKIGDASICICETNCNFSDKNNDVRAIVDVDYRKPVTYNHTATHLLHAALRDTLGDHVRQAGSLVSPDYLRFDFTHFSKIAENDLLAIEAEINRQIQRDAVVNYTYNDFDSAKEMGAMALFGEKYGDTVRVVSIGNVNENAISLELCGGCHVKHTGEIGAFIITSESSVASGVRRIEAITGEKAIEYMQQQRSVVSELDHLLNAKTAELPERIKNLQDQVKSLEKELQQVQSKQVFGQLDEMMKNAEKIGEISFVSKEFENFDVNMLKDLGDELRQKSKSTVGFFINKNDDGKMNMVCAVTDDLIKAKKLLAGNIVREAAKIAGGGGGGKPHLATAGAKNSDELPNVFAYLRDTLSAI